MKYHENVLVFAKGKTVFNPIMEKRSDVGIDRLKNNGKVLDGSNNTSQFMSFKRGQGIYREYDKEKVYPKSVQKIGSVPNCNGTKLHPTQKPVALFEYFIKTYTNEGDLVLDNCSGSGTTGIAAWRQKRNAILIEKDELYFNAAKERFYRETRQVAMF
jgi:site-specific DNA-methyltransferase (adenine-specific)